MFGKSKPVSVAPVAPVAPTAAAQRNFVEELARTAAPVMPLSETAEVELERLTNLQSQLLPIEAETRRRVDQRIGHLLAAKELPYKRLSLEPLSWRDAKGYPVFAVYPLTSSITTINMSPFSMRRGIQPEVPSAMAGELLRGVTVPDHIFLHSTFQGLIPSEVRTEIAKAVPMFGDGIFIMAEANWQEVVRPKGDPLVVGWRADALWLIAQFDTTDLESYVVSEFPG